MEESKTIDISFTPEEFDAFTNLVTSMIIEKLPFDEALERVKDQSGAVSSALNKLAEAEDSFNKIHYTFVKF